MIVTFHHLINPIQLYNLARINVCMADAMAINVTVVRDGEVIAVMKVGSLSIVQSDRVYSSCIKATVVSLVFQLIADRHARMVEHAFMLITVSALLATMDAHVTALTLYKSIYYHAQVIWSLKLHWITTN